MGVEGSLEIEGVGVVRGGGYLNKQRSLSEGLVCKADISATFDLVEAEEAIVAAGF